MDLRNTQLKDTYGNLVTTGTTAGSPTTGGLQNGQGTLLTSVGIGTDSPNALLELSGRSDTGDITMRFADKDGGVLTGQDHSNIEYFATDGSAVSAEVKTIYADVVGGLDYTISTRAGGGSLAERLRIRSTGDISFRDGSASEAFYWDASTARLGIGTTSPSQDLEILNGIAGAGIRLAATNTAYWDIERDSTSGHLTFTDDGAGTVLTVGQDGKVGIGVTPTAPFQLAKTGTAPSGTGNGYGLYITPATSGEIFIDSITGSSGNTSASLRTYNNGTYTKVISNASGNTTTFETAGSERLRINSSGNVGIGTDAPLAPLNIGVDSATASPIRAIKLGAGTTVVGNGQYIQFSTSTVDSLGSQIQGVRAGAGASSDLRFLTTNTSSVVSEKMRIDSDGKVGIGTATLNTISGTNATLTLGGSGISGGLILQTAGTDKGRLYESSNLIIHQGMSSVGHSFYVNASTEAMRIDSSGNVGINCTPVKKLQVTNGVSGDAGNLLLVNTNDTNGDTASLQFSMTDSDSFNKAGIFFERTTTQGRGSLHLANNIENNSNNVTKNDARLTIDSSGNVGIGTNTVLGSATRLHVKVDDSNTDFSLGTPYHLLIENDNTTTNTGAMLGLRADTADGGIALHYGGSANVGYMTFHVDAGGGANSERMRIDSSGNVLVGKTTSSIASEGVELFPNDRSAFTRDSGYSILVNRLTSDGDLINFRKDGTSIGSIGTEGGDMAIGNDDAGIQFVNGNEHFRPFNMTSNTSTDNLMDIGSSSKRFKDLYLSGSVYLGGTTSANALDDYEEGTHDTTITCGTSGTITLGGSNEKLQYTKIGRLVTVSGRVAISGVSSPTGNFTMSLPFTIADLDDESGRSTGGIKIFNTSTNVDNFFFTAHEGNAFITVFKGGSTNGTSDSADTFSGNETIALSVTYVAS
jgi:hypothetical protein